MSFQDILYIWLAVLFAAYVSGWVVHIMGPRTRNLSDVSYHAPTDPAAERIQSAHSRILPARAEHRLLALRSLYRLSPAGGRETAGDVATVTYLDIQVTRTRRNVGDGEDTRRTAHNPVMTGMGISMMTGVDTIPAMRREHFWIRVGKL